MLTLLNAPLKDLFKPKVLGIQMAAKSKVSYEREFKLTQDSCSNPVHMGFLGVLRFPFTSSWKRFWFYHDRAYDKTVYEGKSLLN